MPLVPVDLGAKEHSPMPTPRSIRARGSTLVLTTAPRSAKCRPSCATSKKPIRAAAARDDAEDQGQVTMWERRVEQEGFASVMEAVSQHVPGLKNRAIAGPHDYDQIPALVERSKTARQEFLRRL